MLVAANLPNKDMRVNDHYFDCIDELIHIRTNMYLSLLQFLSVTTQPSIMSPSLSRGRGRSLQDPQRLAMLTATLWVNTFLYCSVTIFAGELTYLVKSAPLPEVGRLSLSEAMALADRVDPRIQQQHPEVLKHLRDMESPEARLQYLVSLRASIKAKDANSGGVPAAGEAFDQDNLSSDKHDLHDKLQRNQVGPISHITAFNCSSEKTVFQTLSLLEPKLCETPEAMYSDPLNVSVQILGRARLLPVEMVACRLTITEKVTRCGFDSVSYGTREITTDKPIHLNPETCAKAVDQGYLNYDGQQFHIPSNNSKTTKSWYGLGFLDDDHKCAYASFTRRVQGKQVLFTNSYLEIRGTLVVETILGRHNPHTGKVVWANGIVAHYPDKVAYDDLAGTMVWKSIPVTCQRSMATLYQGPAQLMKHRDNRNSFIEENDLIFVEQPAQGRYAAFSIDQRDELCSRSILRTQMSAVIIHELTPSTPPILVDDVHVDSLMEIQASSNQAFHHFKGHLKGHEVTTFTHSTICQGERQMMFGFLSMAAAENKYSLYGKFGEGYSITRAGAVVHIGQCPPVSAQIRQSPNCTQEVPVVVEGQEAWVDPITRNLVDFPTPVPCDPLNPVTFRLDGRWMCATPDFHPCPDPLQLSPNSRDNTGIELYYKFARGTGRGIVTQSTLQKHLDFVHEAMARGPASRMVNNLYKEYYGSMGSRFQDGNHDDWGTVQRGISPFLSQEVMNQVTNRVGGRLFFFFRMFGDKGTFILSVFVFVAMIWGVICAFARCFKVYEAAGCGCAMFQAFFTSSFMFLALPVLPLTAMYHYLVDNPEFREELKDTRKNRWKVSDFFGFRTRKHYHDLYDDRVAATEATTTFNQGAASSTAAQNRYVNPYSSDAPEEQRLMGGVKRLASTMTGVPLPQGHQETSFTIQDRSRLSTDSAPPPEYDIAARNAALQAEHASRMAASRNSARYPTEDLRAARASTGNLSTLNNTGADLDDGHPAGRGRGYSPSP